MIGVELQEMRLKTIAAEHCPFERADLNNAHPCNRHVFYATNPYGVKAYFSVALAASYYLFCRQCAALELNSRFTGKQIRALFDLGQIMFDLDSEVFIVKKEAKRDFPSK